MIHHEKHGKNDIMECKQRISVPNDLKGIVETIKNELSTTAEINFNIKKASQPTKINDLSVDDKRKILGLVNMLGKVNQDKDIYCEQLAKYCNEVKFFQSEIIRIKEVHQDEKLNLCSKIDELKETINTSKQNQESELNEFRLYKTQKEIQMTNLRSEHLQYIQNLQDELQNKLDNQKQIYEQKMNVLNDKINKQENLLKVQAQDHKAIENSSKLMIEQLQKENIALQNRVNVCRTKLKSAFYALKKIKRKLDSKPPVCTRSIQTKDSFINEDCKSKIKWFNDKQTNSIPPPLSDQALISELFFNKEKSNLLLDPLFHSENLQKNFNRTTAEEVQLMESKKENSNKIC